MKRAVVVGSGYSGMTVARALDDVVEVWLAVSTGTMARAHLLSHPICSINSGSAPRIGR